MAVLTSPRRTRPRFGPQAGLVAATRGVAFAALMAAGIGLLIMIVAAVFLIALGAGILIVGNGGPAISVCCWPSWLSAPGWA
jgi:hypothetical protein